MQRGWREPLIGKRGLGLHVQLSSRQVEKGAGQLEERGKDLCQRRSIYPHRETDRQQDRNIAYRDIRRSSQEGETKNDKNIFLKYSNTKKKKEFFVFIQGSRFAFCTWPLRCLNYTVIYYWILNLAIIPHYTSFFCFVFFISWQHFRTLLCGLPLFTEYTVRWTWNIMTFQNNLSVDSQLKKKKEDNYHLRETTVSQIYDWIIFIGLLLNK